MLDLFNNVDQDLKREGKETLVSIADFVQAAIGWAMSQPFNMVLAILAIIMVKNKGKLQIGKLFKLG